MVSYRNAVLLGFVVLVLTSVLFSQNLSTSDDGLGIVEQPQDGFVLSADGDSWLSGWDYRQQINITGQTGAGTNYQIEIPFNYDATGVTGEVNFSSNCQTDFGDIRFTDGDGDTLIDFWIEEKTDSDDGNLWVEVRDDLGSNQVIYVYYGTSGTTTTSSNGVNTFIFFDDFENNNFNRWDAAGDCWSTQGTVKKHGSYAAYGADDADSGERYLKTAGSTFAWDTDFMMHMYSRVENVGATSTNFPFYGLNADSGGTAFPLRMTANDWAADNGPIVYYEQNTISVDTWYDVELAFDYTNSLFKLWVDGSAKTSQDLEDSSGDAFTSFEEFWIIDDKNSGDDWWIDDVYIRNWIATEPSISAFGSEEVGNTAPVNDQAPSCSNLDDTDNLYAEYREYDISSNVTDVDGFADIDYVELSAMNGASVVWTVRFDEDTATFSEQVNATYITLGTCSSTSSGNNLNITWEITIAWYHEDLDDLDLKQYVIDTGADSDTDTYDVNYDFVSTVDITDTNDDYAGSVYVGQFNEEFTVSGNIYYDGTTTKVPSGSVDIHIYCDAVSTSPWSDTTTTGEYSITCQADDEIGTDTFYIFAVPDGDGFAGTQLNSSSFYAVYSADIIYIRFITNTSWTTVDDYFEVDMYAWSALFGINVTAEYIISFGTVIPDWTYEETYHAVLRFRTAGEYTFNVTTAFAEDYYGVAHDGAGYQCFTDTIIVDDIYISSGPSYFWTQYSTDSVWLIWGNPISVAWENNDSLVTDGTRLQSYCNGTANSWLTLDGSSASGLAIGPFNTKWYYVNISIYVTYEGHSWILWTKILAVDILHSIHIEDSEFGLTDNWVTIGVQTNWNNATFFVWDNVTGTPVLLGASFEGLYQVAKSTVVGHHSLIILVNGTHGTLVSTSQVAGTTDTDSWEYLEYSYTVNPVTFSVTDPFVMQNNETIVFSGIFYTGDLTIDYTIYEGGVNIVSGILTIPSSGSYYVVRWDKTNPQSVAQWLLVMKAGTTNITVYGYNFQIDGSTYTYLSSGHFEGDDVYFGPSDDAAAAIASAAMYDALGNVLLLLAIPVTVGVAVKLDRAKSRPRGKRDKRNDGM